MTQSMRGQLVSFTHHVAPASSHPFPCQGPSMRMGFCYRTQRMKRPHLVLGRDAYLQQERLRPVWGEQQQYQGCTSNHREE